MNIKSMLYTYKDIDRLVREYTAELNTLDYNIKNFKYAPITDNLKASTISGMPHGTETSDPTSAPIINAISRFERRMEEIVLEINRLYDIKTYINLALKELEIKEIKIIELLYFKKLELWQARNELKWGYTTAYDMHRKALDKIQRHINQQITA